MDIQKIDINTYEGEIPSGLDLVVYQEGKEDEALVLYGWDEVGMYDLPNIQYGFA